MKFIVAKWGNSASIRLPSSVLQQLGAEVGAELHGRISDGALILSTSNQDVGALSAEVDALRTQLQELTAQAQKLKK